MTEPTSDSEPESDPADAEPDEVPSDKPDAEMVAPMPATADEFDPMDVLSAPVEKPSASVKHAEPTADRPETPTAVSKSPSTARPPEAGARTVSAAESAMAAMNRPSIPQARGTVRPAVAVAATPTKSIKELVSSPQELLTLFRERPMYTFLLGAILVWLMVFASRGCGEARIPTYPVRGRVVFTDGSPVKTGTIVFESTEYRKDSTGRINEDGSFVLGTYESEDGAPAGDHRVAVMQMVIIDPTVKHEKDHGSPLDPRFARYETSGLTATVKPDDSNILTIQVEPQRRYEDQYQPE